MEILGNVLGGLGVMGLLAALMAGFLLVLVLPWWAIFDCAQSRRSGGVKAAIVALLLFSWGLGSVVYGLFFSTTRALRRVTVATVCGVAAVLALSM
ncbi:MAG TPA: hypothetical protein VNL37_02020, partial [Candidatus Polarisedimenticolia bacterium]|nr:hypothetical protein [Candidatus Polarisedimenticolia bacterium]